MFNHSSSSDSQLNSFVSFLISDFCLDSPAAMYVFLAYSSTHLIIQLPLSTFMLSVGYQRWRQQQSSAVMSPFDFYTFNMAVMELIECLGTVIAICSSFFKLLEILFGGILITLFPWVAQMLFPVMICVERYQAAVHPIAYMRLRGAGGVWIRNSSALLIWLLCFAGLGMMFLMMKYSVFNLVLACGMAVCLITTVFCSLSVLCALIRPKPGKVGGDRAQSKRRAFKTIIIILGVLLFKFVGNLICYLINVKRVICVVMASQVWFNVPCSLVLPLLFLHRTGKIPGCRPNT